LGQGAQQAHDDGARDQDSRAYSHQISGANALYIRTAYIGTATICHENDGSLAATIHGDFNFKLPIGMAAIVRSQDFET